MKWWYLVPLLAGRSMGKDTAMKRLLAAGLLTLAWRFSAGAELVCHDFTLEQLLPGGQAVVLMVERDDNTVRRLAATVAGQPAALCQIKTHDLQVAGNRVRGSLQLVAGAFAETVRLDVAPGSGGTWSLATGLRKVTGDLRVQPATLVSNAHWAVSCESAMGPYSQLTFYLQTNSCAVVELRGFQQAILGSLSGRGVVIYDEALTGTRVWSAGSLEQVAATLAPGRRGDKLAPEFSRLEKFLELYAKHCGPPQALCLYVWDASSSKEVADVYEGRKVASVTMKPSSPLLVAVWDPATDTTTDTEVPGIGEPGGEAIWRPLFEGVRALVLKRGWPERCIVAGMGGDIRPSQRVGEVLRDWAPYARWYLLSHFSGDPAPKDGRLIASGGLEIGMKEYPAGGCLPVAELERRVLAPGEFLELPTFREHDDNMTPFMFRTVPMKWGAVGRLALDFWPGRGGPRCNSWFSHTERLTVPGEDGALPTVRFQMFREGVQDHEIRAAIIRAYAPLPADQRQPYRALFEEFVTRHDWGSRYLSQMELAYDYPAYLARLHAAAAELAGTKMTHRWEEPDS